MIVGNKDIPGQQAAACAAIDAAAESVRQMYLTEGFGQAIVYLQKLSEAQRFIAAYPTSTSTGVPTSADTTDWPFVSAELGITASTMWGVANAVVAANAAWVPVATQIETLRLGAKASVNAATTGSAIQAAQTITWPGASTTATTSTTTTLTTSEANAVTELAEA